MSKSVMALFSNPEKLKQQRVEHAEKAFAAVSPWYSRKLRPLFPADYDRLTCSSFNLILHIHDSLFLNLWHRLILT